MDVYCNTVGVLCPILLFPVTPYAFLLAKDRLHVACKESVDVLIECVF